MSVLWTAKEAVKATGGAAKGDWAASGLSIDTRSLQKGDLFIALKGDHADGHAYAKQAIDKGAAAAMVAHPVEGVPVEKLLIVQDTLEGLRALGISARDRSSAQRIAVTGSVGKTTTKEMLKLAFDAQGQTHASGKSFNNHWGVPFSLASMNAGNDTGIFEIGMNHHGEITPLVDMVRPHMAIVTAIAPVHMEYFKDLQDIATAKAEIFTGLREGGIAILNKDDGQFDYLSQKAKENGAQIYTFGQDKAADAQMTDCLEAANGTRVTAMIQGEKVVFTLFDGGAHLAMNGLATLLAVKLSGGNIQKAAKALEKFRPVAGRGKREKINIGDKNNPVTLIDESYNASPAAMNAAFRVLAMIDPGRGGRRIAILGDMAELGDAAPRLHKELAMPLEAAGVQLVYTCGPLMKNLHDSLSNDCKKVHRDTPPELAEIVPDVLIPGDVVLVKGSRGGGEKPKMQVIVEALRAMER